MKEKKYLPPKTSPWGELVHCEEIAPGMYEIDTDFFGGFMIHANVARNRLSPKALAHSFQYDDFVCFYEEPGFAFVFYELLKNPDWEKPTSYSGTRAEFAKMVYARRKKWMHDERVYRKRERNQQKKSQRGGR